MHGAQEEEYQREAQHVSEFARQGAEDVGSVDGIALHEKEGQGHDGRQGGERASYPPQAPQSVRRGREGEDPEHRDDLERYLVRDEPIEDGDQQEGEREVEREHGHARVPPGGPAGEAEIRQKFLDQVLRRIVMGAGVTAGGRGETEKQVGLVEGEENGVDRQEGEKRGHPVPDAPFFD